MNILFRSRSFDGWTGGLNYYNNLMHAIKRADAKSQILVLVDRHKNVFDRAYVDREVDIHLPSRFTANWLKHKAVELVAGKQAAYKSINSWIDEVDISFQVYDQTINNLVPNLGWIPDFQHLRLPEFFTEEQRQEREQQFGYIAKHADRVVLSSKDSKNDFEEAYPEFSEKAFVLPFSVCVPVDIWESDVHLVLDKYDLPDDYWYIPNQFWKHKNHRVVVDALVEDRDKIIPPIVTTGGSHDPRNPDFFGTLMSKVEKQGLQDRFIYIGKISYRDVLVLLKGAIGLINPSLFEGWSTVVEEAKVLGKPLILSDINVHREQAQDALFFDPSSPESLIEAIKNFGKGNNPDRNTRQLKQKMVARHKAFGERFLNCCQKLQQS